MKKRTSIRRRLLLMLIPALITVWLVVVLLVHRAAQHEITEVFDADMVRSARILQALLLHEVVEETDIAAKAREVFEELGPAIVESHPRLSEILGDNLDREAAERIEMATTAQRAGRRYGNGLIFVARYRDGRIMAHDSIAPEVPETPHGFSDVWIADETWRVFSLSDVQTGFSVQVGERIAYRNELADYITRNTLTPLLVALPVLALLAWILVGSALAPLRRVVQEVSYRAPTSLQAIDQHDAPREIESLVQALNTLFARVRSVMARERQFTADAAHELRTPLAALKTQLQVAQQRISDDDAQAALQGSLHGVDRATHTVEQLLNLARADARQAREQGMEQLDLTELAIDCVASLSQAAFERNIDLGVDAGDHVNVHGDPSALQVLLRNLVDNAVRYTPRGGTVTVAVGEDAGAAWLRVSDNGPGIAEEEHDRVFDRFYRGNREQLTGIVGSGLGLSIVDRIVRLHDARIALGPGLDGTGLGVTVSFPAGTAPT